MEALLAVGLIGVLGYSVWTDMKSEGLVGVINDRKRLCDYYCSGTTYAEAYQTVTSGRRLLEVHLYADENGKPIVAKQRIDPSYDYAYDYWTFDEVCVALNAAFPSNDPFILSIVPHTTNSVTLNRAAHILKITNRKYLLDLKEGIHSIPIDELANKLVIVSGGIQGTELGDMINLSWSESHLRHLTYGQAIHPRDQPELVAFNRNNITIVAPDVVFDTSKVNPDTAFAYGCQWILFETNRAAPGFVEKPQSLRGR
jgi:hypothetical protein